MISRKPYGFWVFFMVINAQFNNCEIGILDIHDRLIPPRPTYQSLSVYLKDCNGSLYDIKSSDLKKNKKLIRVTDHSLDEFTKIYSSYLKDLMPIMNDEISRIVDRSIEHI